MNNLPFFYNPFFLSFFVFLITVTPAFIQSKFGFSQSYGVLLISIIVILCNLYVTRFKFIESYRGYNHPLLILFLFIFFHSLLLFIFGDINNKRLIFSFFSLCIIFFCCKPIINGLSFICKSNVLNRCLHYIFYFYLIILFISPINFFTFQVSGKPVVFFNEISLFTVTFAPIFFYICIVSPQRINLLLVSIVSIFAIQINSLLFALLCLFIAIFSLKVTFLILFLLFSSLILINDTFIREIFSIFYLSLNTYIDVIVNYITSFFHPQHLPYLQSEETYQLNESTIQSNLIHLERADLAFHDYVKTRVTIQNNISHLYFISGWERAIINIQHTFGYGLGLQQLGFEANYGYFQTKLTEALGRPMGLRSGGSVGSKIISEFGLFGFIFILYYIWNALKLVLSLRLLSIGQSKKSLIDILMMCIFTSYGFSLFLRGEGYFNIAGFLFIISLYWLLSQHRINK